VLSGGGRLNYAGTNNWVNRLGNEVLDNLEFVLCLETISTENLYLHISKKTQDVRLYKQFQNTAKEMKINLEFIFKNIDISNPEISWEHQIISYNKKIPTATLSGRKTPAPQLSRTSSLDFSINSDLLKRNIKFIAESLSQYIYQQKTGKF
jgi:hypothetical protein